MQPAAITLAQLVTFYKLILFCYLHLDFSFCIHFFNVCAFKCLYVKSAVELKLSSVVCTGGNT